MLFYRPTELISFYGSITQFYFQVRQISVAYFIRQDQLAARGKLIIIINSYLDVSQVVVEWDQNHCLNYLLWLIQLIQFLMFFLKAKNPIIVFVVFEVTKCWFHCKKKHRQTTFPRKFFISLAWLGEQDVEDLIKDQVIL